MVDVLRGSAADPEGLIQEALASGRTSIIIRNQPAGSVKLIRVDNINRLLVAVQPDGSVVTATDPNVAIVGSLNARFVLEGEATVSKSGVVLAGTKLKVGTPVELEGALYRLNGTVSGVKVQ
jgi:cyanophycinase-like exopeptidase